MPLHDFYCGRCNQVILNQYVPVAIGATAGAPACPTCGTTTVWIPAAPALHYGDVKGAAFKSFDTTDGRGNPVHIDSLAKLRKVEREAEQAYRNGEGQPMVFRAWAQDQASDNKLDSALHRSYDGSEQPTAASKQRFGTSLRKSATEPDSGYGPGVSDANASALAMSGKE